MFPTPISLYDLILTPTALSSIALIVLFHISAPFFPDTKRLAWVLSTITSLTMSLTSLPFLWDYFVHRGDLKLVRQVPELALIVNRFFQAYLVTRTYHSALMG
ncbi:hypothetical protein H0H93_015356 [Arthromyces matolae]|nr:hypothetical protein H0H93_015356 [Arthromyces matolae]